MTMLSLVVCLLPIFVFGGTLDCNAGECDCFCPTGKKVNGSLVLGDGTCQSKLGGADRLVGDTCEEKKATLTPEYQTGAADACCYGRATTSAVSSDDVRNVQWSWGQLKINLGGNLTAGGALFYDKLFKIKPEFRSLFSSHSSLDGMRAKVMGTLDAAVGLLDDVDTLGPILTNLGTKHVNYCVYKEYFGYVGDALVQTLDAGLGQNFTNPVKASWGAVLGVVVDVMGAPMATAETNGTYPTSCSKITPTTDAPATDAPATDAPATDAPATDAPTTDAPATDAPATNAPGTNAPATNTAVPVTSDTTSTIFFSAAAAFVVAASVAMNGLS